MWVNCDYNKACLVQGANKRVQVWHLTGWKDADNSLPLLPYARGIGVEGFYRYDSRDYPTDQPKSRPDLFPPRALQLAGEVLAFGETKYPDEKWKRMSSEEHIAAAVRHYVLHQCGEKIDKESGKEHLVHCLVRVAMAVECEYHTNN